ncbi:MAG: hypothetical protein R3321_03690 [Nitrososphaeraceae archaeon]|nr:hypothetical protein [Nitrososphaeraceae archaeon]
MINYLKRSNLIYLVPVFSVLIVYGLTLNPYGIGITPDSVAYLELAQNISHGEGYVLHGKFVTHWPPFYPFIIGIIDKITKIDILNIAKYLNLTLLFTIAITTLKLLKYYKVHFSLKISIPSLILVSTALTVSLYAWSELLFIQLTLLSFLFSIQGIKNYKSSYLFYGGLIGFLSLLTRYAGIGFIFGQFFIFLIYLPDKNYLKKIIRILVFSAPIIVGIIIWGYVITHMNSHSVDRSITFHPVDSQKILNILRTLKIWFFSNPLFVIIPITVIAALSFYIKVSIKDFLKALKQVPGSLLIMIFSYLFFLLVSIHFFDANTPLDNRLLSPIFPFLLIAICKILDSFRKLNNRNDINVLLILTLSSSILSSSFSFYNYHYKNGAGFTSVHNKNIINIIEQALTKKDLTIYTNNVSFFEFKFAHSNHIVSSLPNSYNPINHNKNLEFSIQLKKIKNSISKKNAVIVFFYDMERKYTVSSHLLTKNLEKSAIKHFNWGLIID